MTIIMSNPFQIGEDADLSFGDEDFLLDSIDLEAIAAKALQTDPRNYHQSNSTSTGLAKPFQSANAQQANSREEIDKQFQAHTGQNLSSAASGTLSTPQANRKKFTFKPKKSPENAQIVDKSRSVLSPLQTTQKYAASSASSSQSVSPAIANAVSAAPTNGRAVSEARIPGGTTSNISHGLRTPNYQSQMAHDVRQPTIAVTVKRDGTNVTKVCQPTFDPKVGQRLAHSSSSGPSVGSARQASSKEPVLECSSKLTMTKNHVTDMRSEGLSPVCSPNLAIKSAKSFQKYIPPVAEGTFYTNSQAKNPDGTTPSTSQGLRTPNFQTQARTGRSAHSNQVTSSMTSQLRNPSQSSVTSNPSKTISVAPHQVASTALRQAAGSGSAPQNSLRTKSGSMSMNQSEQSFRRHQTTMVPFNTQNQQNIASNSQVKSHTVLSTPGPSAAFQTRRASPMQASTPGYGTPSGRPSPASSGSHGGATSMPQPGQSLRYPVTPRTSGSSGTSTTSGMRVNGNRHGNTPQVPLLTPRVAQMCQTPSGSGSRTTIRTRARKFPGPAGVLPKLIPGQKLDDAVVEDVSVEKIPKPAPSADDSINIPSTQDVGVDEFQRGAWLTMKTELGECANSILTSYNIAIVLRKASLKQLPRKQVPNLCVMIRSVTHNVNDACVLLKDPSGEMQGTVHRKIVEDYQSDLKPGSVMVLRKVGVLSPSIRNHYLNITPSNLVQVYPAESCSTSCSQASPKSQGTHSRINRSPENKQPSDRMQDSQSLSPKDRVNRLGLKTQDNTSPTSPSGYRQRQLTTDANSDGLRQLPQSKTLQIEGVNTPERVYTQRSSLVSKQQLSMCPDMVKRGQQTKTLLIEGVDLPQVQESEGNQSLSHSGDSGIHLDQSSSGFDQIEVAKSHGSAVGETKHFVEKQNRQIEDHTSSNLSWLRKRQTGEGDEMTKISSRNGDEEFPSKRLRLEASKPNSVTTLTSLQEAAGIQEDDNFDSLMEGIEHEFFDDF